VGENDAYELLQRGRELLDEENPVQAAFVLERAKHVQPGKGSILETLGRAYFACGRYKESAESFKEALGVDPTNDYAHYCLGLCCLKMDLGIEAAGHFKMAWSLKPLEMYAKKASRFGVADTPRASGSGAN
jgi:tetratricopeptide (TPR) repeat protein